MIAPVVPTSAMHDAGGIAEVLAEAAVRNGVYEVLGWAGPPAALVALTLGVLWLGFRRG